MEINEETYELFDRCFSGSLPANEKAAFEKELEGNEALRKEYEWMQLAISGIQMNGKSILKKQLAEIGAAIPASAFEKYSPSIRPKSFFRKWWWAIIIALALAAGVIIAWPALHKKLSPESKTHVVHEKVTMMDVPAKNNDAHSADTIRQPFSEPTKSETKINTVKDTAKAMIFPVIENDNDCHSFSLPVLQQQNRFWDEDTSGLHRMDYIFTASGSQTLVRVLVDICPQKNKPAYYVFDQHVLLAGYYADTTGLRFYQSASRLIMTDGKPGYFILTKGQKEKPLKRLAWSTSRDAEIGDTVKTFTGQDR